MDCIKGNNEYEIAIWESRLDGTLLGFGRTISTPSTFLITQVRHTMGQLSSWVVSKNLCAA